MKIGLKEKMRRSLRKRVKKLYHWIMQSGSVNSAEKKDIYVNDIKFNISNDDLDMESKMIMVSQMFYNKVGYYPDIKDPKTLSEKALWLKLHYQNSLITICSDKYRAKSYIDGIIGPGYTVPVIKKYDRAALIDFDELPDRFVLKVNWCTGYNVIVTDKSLIDREEVKSKLDLWRLPWKSSYYGSFNWGYRDMKPVIFAEEYLDIPSNNLEYKMFCFNGRVRFILVEADFFGKHPKRGFYDRSWQEEKFQIGKNERAYDIPRPENYDTMVEIAEKLAEPFPYVRIDFYNIEGKIYVGEMTFYSGGGFSEIIPGEADVYLGRELDISGAMESMKWDINDI